MPSVVWSSTNEIRTKLETPPVPQNSSSSMVVMGSNKSLFHECPYLQAAGVAPDEATYNTLVSAYVGMGDMPAGEAVMRGMRKPSVRTITVLINGYVEQQEVHKARMVREVGGVGPVAELVGNIVHVI